MRQNPPTSPRYTHLQRLVDDKARITHPVAGNSESFSYYPNSARVQTRTIVDPIGSRQMTAVFDPFGRLKGDTAVGIPPAADVTTSYLYDAASRQTQVTDPLGFVTVNAYDGTGRLTSVTEDAGGANQRVVAFAYTQAGDLLTQAANDGEGPQVTTYTHDRAGRRTQIQHPGTPVTTIQFTYDLASRIRTRTTEDGFVTYYVRNWRGQPVEKRQNSATGTLLESFSYDALGRLFDTSRAGSPAYSSVFVYGNGVNGPAFVDDPLSVTQTVNGLSRTVSYAYNTAGERTLLGYPAGASTTLSYAARDGFGQVTALDRNGSRLANFTCAGRQVLTRQVRTTAGPGETWIELAYTRPDQLRRPKTITNQVRTGSTNGAGGSVAASMSYTNTFDAASNLDTQSVANHALAPENGLTDHTYDRLHRITASNYPNTTLDESWTLDALSNWTAHTARNGVTRTYTDNILNQYTAISGQLSSPAYDAKGNLIRNEEYFGFSYDFENRLTRVFTDQNVNGVFDAGDAMLAEYVVDPLGRRVQATVAGLASSVTTYRYYDGQLLVAEYNAASTGTPAQVFVNGPTYDDEKLLFRSAGGVEFYYLLKDLYSVAGLTTANGCVAASYVYDGYGDGGAIPPAKGDSPNDFDIFVDLYDVAEMQTCFAGPGVTVASDCQVFNYQGADQDVDLLDIKQFVQCLTGPVPVVYDGSSIYGNPFAFTGQRRDRFTHLFSSEPLDLYDYKARAYDPKHGRFLQRDPAEFEDSYNLYEYALSRPNVLTDPMGQFSLPEISVATAIRVGLQALNRYTQLKAAKQTVQALRSGVAVSEVIRGLIIDAVLDKLGGKLFDKALSVLGQFSSKFFSKLRRVVVCCFVEGTSVETPTGPVPIEHLRPGDLVVSRDQVNPVGPQVIRRVCQVFQRRAPEILWVALDSGELLGTTPGHVVWSVDAGWVQASELLVGDKLVAVDGALVTVLNIGLHRTPTATYNLEVEHTATFFAGGVWVHNTSCDVLDQTARTLSTKGNVPIVNSLSDPDATSKLKELFGEATYQIQPNGTVLITNGRHTLRLVPGQVDANGNVLAHMHYQNPSGHGDNVLFPAGTTWLDILDVVTQP